MQGMTEWNASEYARISSLQAAMAEEVLASLDLKGRNGFLMSVAEREDHG